MSNETPSPVSRRRAAPARRAPLPADGLVRCAWAEAGQDAQMRAYHDTEWGVPIWDGRALLEKLLLDGLQAGLSWRTILHRRAGLRAALDGFDPHAMADYDGARIEALMLDARLIRSRTKIVAMVNNARAYLEVDNFSALLWGFVDGRPQQHARTDAALAPTQSPASVAMSQALRARNFSFCGPVICYAFMQAVGMLNDHDAGCHRRAQLAR